MRRMRFAALIVPVALLLSAGPVAADTTPGGSGTFFSSGNEVCTTSGGRQVCTDTTLDVQSFDDGTAQTCLDILTFSIGSNGRQTFVSDRFGCADVANITISSSYSVTVSATDVSMQTCKAHQRQCSGASTATVSASDALTGPVSKTTTRSTTVQGGCTFKTTSNETFGEVAGTITIDGVTSDEQGGFDMINSTTTVRCK